MGNVSKRVKYGRYYYLEYFLVGFLTELCLSILLYYQFSLPVEFFIEKAPVKAKILLNLVNHDSEYHIHPINKFKEYFFYVVPTSEETSFLTF